MFKSVLSLVFGFQFMISLLLFIRNARSIRKISHYVDIQERMSRGLRLTPVLIAALTGIAVSSMTGYHVTTMVMVMILLPVLHHHWIISPLAVRSVVDIDDMGDEKIRNMISKGVRSRILTVCICMNLFMTYYVLFCP